jgi:hypothetical protein
MEFKKQMEEDSGNEDLSPSLSLWQLCDGKLEGRLHNWGP